MTKNSFKAVYSIEEPDKRKPMTDWDELFDGFVSMATGYAELLDLPNPEQPVWKNVSIIRSALRHRQGKNKFMQVIICQRKDKIYFENTDITSLGR